jgi:hypothetical protein
MADIRNSDKYLSIQLQELTTVEPRRLHNAHIKQLTCGLLCINMSRVNCTTWTYHPIEFSTYKTTVIPNAHGNSSVRIANLTCLTQMLI